jgi:uncharacterized protein DUF4904
MNLPGRVAAFLLSLPLAIGCATSARRTESREAVERLLETYAQAMKTGDWGSVSFAPNVTFLGPLTNGPIEGDAAVREFLRRVSADVKDLRVKRRVIDGELACVIAELESKEGVVVPFTEFFRIVDGMIAEVRPYFDPRPLIR